MLALAHTLVSEGLHDRAFLARYCVGYERFEAYVLGTSDACPEDARVGRAAVRNPRREHSRARPADGRETDADQRELLAPARRARRAGAVARRDVGGDARPDRAAGRRLRSGLRFARLHRSRAAARGPADVGAGPKPRERLHPLRTGRGHAARSGRAVRLRRPAPHLPGHPPRLLVRRQPVSSPSGPGAPAPRARSTGDDRRPRLVLDADGPPRRRRAAGDDDARAERHRRLAERPVSHRHASGGRAVGAGPERLRDLRRPRQARWESPSASPKAGTSWRGSDTSTESGARASRTRAARRRRSTSSGTLASSRSAESTTTWCCSSDSGTIRRAHPSARRAGSSRSSRPRSTDSATTIARATRPGSSPPSGSGRGSPSDSRF